MHRFWNHSEKRPAPAGLLLLFLLLFLLPGRGAWAGTVTFSANGVTGTMEDVTTSASSDTLPACRYTRYGYIFRGWVTDLSHETPDYDDQAEVPTDENLTLYALWEPQLYIVHFDANGGLGSMSDIYGIYNEPLTLPKSTFTTTKFLFNGWIDTSTGARYADGGTVENLKSGSTYSRKILTVDAGKPKNTKYSFQSTQGSCVYDEDGTRYLVTAASINDRAYYKGNLSHYETVLTKYDLSTGEVVARARNLDFDHGNGICYSPESGHLYIAEGGTLDGYPSGVMEVDQNLKEVKHYTFPLLNNIWAIAYADHHFYLIGKNENSRNSLCVLNDDMQTLSITELDNYYTNFSSQGIAADANFIYALIAGFKTYEWKSKQRINVFTHDGTYVGVWTFDIPEEAEDITVVDQYAYITTNEKNESTLYRTRLPETTLTAIWKK